MLEQQPHGEPSLLGRVAADRTGDRAAAEERGDLRTVLEAQQRGTSGRICIMNRAADLGHAAAEDDERIESGTAAEQGTGVHVGELGGGLGLGGHCERQIFIERVCERLLLRRDAARGAQYADPAAAAEQKPEHSRRRAACLLHILLDAAQARHVFRRAVDENERNIRIMQGAERGFHRLIIRRAGDDAGRSALAEFPQTGGLLLCVGGLGLAQVERDVEAREILPHALDAAPQRGGSCCVR